MPRSRDPWRAAPAIGALLVALGGIARGQGAPALDAAFAGIPWTGFFPPDPVVAAGPNGLVTEVNGLIALMSKDGVTTATRVLTDFYGGSLSGSYVYDPRIIFDPHSGRFFSVALDGEASPQSWIRLAFSKSDTPLDLMVGTLGAWSGFDIDADLDGGMQLSNDYADFPGLGVDQYNLYLTAYMFQTGGIYPDYVKVWAIPKAALLAGGPVAVHEFGGPPGPRLKNPATGAVDFYIAPTINLDPTAEHMVATPIASAPGGFGHATLWTVNDPGGTPTLSATDLLLPEWQGRYLPSCPQAGGGAPLDTGLVETVQGVERGGRLWAVHAQPNALSGGTVTEAHWYAIDTAAATIIDSGSVTDPTRCYFFPALHPDGEGNVALVMSGVDATIFGSTFYTVRRSDDPPGTMRPVASLQAGLAHYVQLDSSALQRNRWGDLGGIATDPASGEIWMVHEYAAETPDTWATWIGAVSPGSAVTLTMSTTTTTMPGCPVAPTFTSVDCRLLALGAAVEASQVAGLRRPLLELVGRARTRGIRAEALFAQDRAAAARRSLRVAARSLTAFAHRVRAKRGRRLPADVRVALLDAAAGILEDVRSLARPGPST